MKARLALAAVPIVALLATLFVIASPDSAGFEEAGAEETILTTVTEALTTTTTTIATTTTTAAPEPEPAPEPTTTTVAPAPTTTAPPPPPEPTLPLAPPCSTFASQDEADAWMAANAGSHDTSNIDTNGDGVACSLSFAPPPPEPTTNAAPDPGYSSGRCGGDLPPCYVMMRESGGDITAQNPVSTASGKWQFLDSTWQNYGGYAKARYAPEHVQDEKARQLWAGGAGCSHWSAC